METNVKSEQKTAKVRLFLTNHGYFMNDEFDTVERALDKARQTCFQVTFYQAGLPVASWCPIAGFRDLI